MWEFEACGDLNHHDTGPEGRVKFKLTPLALCSPLETSRRVMPPPPAAPPLLPPSRAAAAAAAASAAAPPSPPFHMLQHPGPAWSVPHRARRPAAEQRRRARSQAPPRGCLRLQLMRQRAGPTAAARLRRPFHLAAPSPAELGPPISEGSAWGAGWKASEFCYCALSHVVP